ncbi:nuclear pore complex protein NUP214 [Iris pallida]|uniref:Nuclear pore complex protein NUP214 n=1 Tax=Iris pallida TaxID=29817 RepID=A0AAX6E3R4_IRIPA|nr:nuclear pore complex protein NUP214 [Iris pallida]
MAETNPFPLQEEIEGDRDGTSDFVFVRIGESLPLKPGASAFDPNDPPSQPLAVSGRRRILFLAHSEGFLVARTKDVIGAAKELKESGKGASVEGASVADVRIGRVSILAVPEDESTLAAVVGGEVRFYSVPKLLDKEQEPLFSCSLNGSYTIKDFRWQKTIGKSFLVLSSHGSLYYGSLDTHLKDVSDNVDAADWSVEGDFVAIARKNTIRILSSNFDEQFSMSLLFQTWLTDLDSECSIKVDSIKWVRDDSIIIGCLRVNEDGNEEGYLVQVITSGEHKFSEFSCKPVVYSFPDPFDGIMDDILPVGGGPYLLSSYLDCWEVTLASNRKAVDQHVLLLKWSVDDNRRVVFLEFKNDKYTPKIDLQENGDDNTILGFSVDRFSLYEKVTIKVDSDMKELSPRCILLCLTIEGKLIMYHAARLSEPSDMHQPSPASLGDPFTQNSFTVELPETTTRSELVDNAISDSKLKEISKVGSSANKDQSEVWRGNIFPGNKKEADGPQLNLTDQVTKFIFPGNKKEADGPQLNLTDQVTKFDKSSAESTSLQPPRLVLRNEVKSGTQMHKMSSAQISKEGPNAYKGPSGIQRENILYGNKQEVDGIQLGLLTGQVADKSSAELSNLQVSGSLLKGEGTPGTQTLGKSFADKGLSSIASDDASARHASTEVTRKTGEVSKVVVGSTSISGASFGPQSTRNLFGADGFNGKHSVIASGSSVLNIAQDSSFLSECQSTGQLPRAKNSNRDQQSFTFSSNKAPQNEGHTSSLTRLGNVVNAIHGSPISAQEGSFLRKSQYPVAQPLLENIRASSSPQMLDSEPKLSKQFYNVKDMTEELDKLLSFIEREGGSRDVCTVFQKKSLLALENGLGNLSEISRICRKNTEEQLMKIQQLQNKELQVSARQIYMKGLVQQASNGKYWDIWKQQKLSHEFEVKRQHIVDLQQNLTNHLIELERHFNNLEINRFGESGRVPTGRRGSQSPLQPSRQIQSFHSVYNTLNSQLAAAEHLSECLATQMSVLNINSPPVKRQSFAKELFDSIGLPHEASDFHSPDSKTLGPTPDSIERTSASSNAIEKYQRKYKSSALKSFEPETARRRRDSLGRSWATFEPPKTTVKRIAQEERFRVGADEPFRKAKEAFDSQLEAYVIQQKTNATPASYSSGFSLKEGIQENQVSKSMSNSVFRWAKDVPDLYQTPGSNIRPNKTMQNVSSQMSLSMAPSSTFGVPQSNSKVLFGSPDISGIGSTSMGVHSSSVAKNVASFAPTPSMFASSMSARMTRPAAEAKDQASKNLNLKMGESVHVTSAPRSLKQLTEKPKNSFATTNESNITSFSSIPSLSAGMFGDTAQSTKSTIQSKSTKSASTTPAHTKAAVSTPKISVPLSNSATSAGASSIQPLSAVSNSTIAFVNSSISTQAAGVDNLTSAISASASDSNQSLLSSSLKLSQPQKPLTSISAPSLKSTSSLSVTSGRSSPGTKPEGETNQVASISSITSTVSSYSLSTSSFQSSESPIFSFSTYSTSSSAPQSPSLLSNKVNSRSEQTPPVAPASESTKSEPAKSQSPVTGKDSSLPPTNIGSVSLATSSFQSEMPYSGTPNFSSPNTVKDQGLDAISSQEDEMEEEAPDVTTNVSLGSFGGFGLGSTPPSSAPKSNPFGGSFLTSASSTASSVLTSPVSPGQLFRPATFSLPSAQPVQTSQPVNSGAFSSGSGGGFSGFGQPAQLGVGQQVLGSVLGGFGQSRQLGASMPGGGSSGGGFSPAANSGGFGSAGGFTSIGSSGGGFAAQGGFAGATAGGGFAGAAAGGGFAAAATGGGFAAAATPAGGGFAGAGTSGGFTSGGFGAFGSGTQGGGFSSFSSGAGKPPPQLLTQMRK